MSFLLTDVNSLRLVVRKLCVPYLKARLADCIAVGKKLEVPAGQAKIILVLGLKMIYNEEQDLAG